jgi:hypothetical protein
MSSLDPGQEGADPTALNHAVTAIFWQGLWIPASHAQQRTVNWGLTIGPLGLPSYVAARDDLYASGATLPVALTVPTVFGPSVEVPVGAVPGPSCFVVLGLTGWVAIRRRRRVST